MSPEMLDCFVKMSQSNTNLAPNIGLNTDIFSLGVMLLEIIDPKQI
jgi:hypothetical protein